MLGKRTRSLAPTAMIAATLACGGSVTPLDAGSDAAASDARDAADDAGSYCADAPATTSCCTLDARAQTDAVTEGSFRCRADRLERRDVSGTWSDLGSCAAGDTGCQVDGFDWGPPPIIHWDGVGRAAGSLCLPFDPRAIRGTGSSDVWLLVAASARAGLWHWDGTSWIERFSFDGLDPTALTLDACGGLWVAGTLSAERRPVLYRWDGTAWTERSPTTSSDATASAVHEGLDGTLWVTSSSGAWWWSEGAWHELPGGYYGSVWSASRSDTWFATGASTVLHWDGNALQPFALPTESAYSTVLTGLGANDVWANGLAHWDGTAWSLSPSSGMTTGTALAYTRGDGGTLLALAPHDGCWMYPAGTNVWRFDGTSWSEETDGLVRALPPRSAYGLWWGTSEHDLWVVPAPPDHAC